MSIYENRFKMLRSINPQSQRAFMSRNVAHELSEMNKRYINDLETSGRGDPFYNYDLNPMAHTYKGMGMDIDLNKLRKMKSQQKEQGLQKNTSMQQQRGLQFATIAGEKQGTLEAHYLLNNKGYGMKPEDEFKKDLKKQLKKGKGKIKKPSQPEYKDEFKPKRERIRKPSQPKGDDFSTTLSDEVSGKGKKKGKGVKDKILKMGKDTIVSIGKEVLKKVAPSLLEKGKDLLKDVSHQGLDKGIDFVKSKIEDKIKGLGKKGKGSVGLVGAQTSIPTSVAVKDKLVGSGKKPNKWITFLKGKGLNPRNIPKKDTEAYKKLMKEYRK